jgi:hypothetical protein
MEQIPKEVIEMAEDFYKQLSDSQKEPFMANYLKEQLPLSISFANNIKLLKDKNIRSKCADMFIIIYHCYKYYGVKLPVIKQDVVKNTRKKYIERITQSSKIKQNFHQHMLDTKAIINQDALMDYIILNLSGTDEEHVKYAVIDDLQISNVEISSLLLILNNEMKKHVVDEVN